jgi:hypothetical protein
MKQKPAKDRKHQQKAAMSPEKPSFGTLNYMAECRGAVQKNEGFRWKSPPDSMNRIIRK